MADEIERRWLVKDHRIEDYRNEERFNSVWQPKAYLPAHQQQEVVSTWYPKSIAQYYVGEGLRLRDEKDHHGDHVYTLCRKSGKGTVRQEDEADIRSWEAVQLLIKDCDLYVNKVRLARARYCGTDSDPGETIDIFTNKELEGLCLFEKEFETEEAARNYVLPSFMFDEATEVTDTLTNRQLAEIARTLRRSQGILDLIPTKMPRIVLTGAPCSGKSSFLDWARTARPDLKTVPETATILLGQLGVSYRIGASLFQGTMRDTQLAFEKAAIEQARVMQQKAVIMDRGSLDGADFSGGLDSYCAMLGIRPEDEFRRYDAVVMLGLPSRDVWEKNHTNNPIRRETYDQASVVEQSLKEVWEKHHNFIYLGDFDTWEVKRDAINDMIDTIIQGYNT